MIVRSTLFALITGFALVSPLVAEIATTTSAVTGNELYRPQFHFTAEKNWLNDPNGCVFHDGEYHLFFQHNPQGNLWGNMTWGHAVSSDLVSWKQLADAIKPYGEGTIFSGTAVVDSANTSGFKTGSEKPLVALYTHATKSAGQAVAFSNDKGRTWKLYNDGKHVVPNQGLDAGERDPKVFWHNPTSKWIMVLWVHVNGTIRFFTSSDLKNWEKVSDFTAAGFFECPDLFETSVDGDSTKRRWVLYDAAFNYWIGSFDGRTFIPEAGPLKGEYGKNFYAAQSWNNAPDRTIQIAWMRDGKYPEMPFNQQMSFPCTLDLRTTSEGVRLCREPVKEISGLYEEVVSLTERPLSEEDESLKDISGDLFDIEMTVRPENCKEVGIRFHDQSAVWSQGRVSCLGTSAPLSLADGKIKLRLLLDRTSAELFGNDGTVSMSSCFVPAGRDALLNIFAKGGTAHLEKLVVHRLRSARGITERGNME